MSIYTVYLNKYKVQNINALCSTTKLTPHRVNIKVSLCSDFTIYHKPLAITIEIQRSHSLALSHLYSMATQLNNYTQHWTILIFSTAECRLVSDP